MTWQDSIIRHQDRLDRTAAGLGRQLVADLEAALASLDAELAKGAADRPFTNARFIALRPELVRLLERLQSVLPGLLYQHQTAAAETSVEALREALDALKDTALSVGAEAAAARVSFTRPDIAQVLAVALDGPFDGRRWDAWGAKLAADAVARVESELRQAAVLGEPISAARRRLQQALDMSRTSAERLARTALAAAGDRARMACYEANGDLIAEVEFLAVLDLRTSRVCMGLSGTRYRLDDPAIPRPPRHPCCRSVLVPVARSWESLIGPEGKALDDALDGGEQASMGGPVPAEWTYADWLKRQSPEYLDEALGPTLAAAFRRGVPLSAMASASRPLSLKELRRLYPTKF